jgi:hypothetical protein
MRPLTIDDFARRRGRPFQVRASEQTLDLVLRQVNELPQSGRDGGSFRLEFHGPMQPTLQQGTYPFLIGNQAFPIFIVPIGHATDATRYEAIFY